MVKVRQEKKKFRTPQWKAHGDPQKRDLKHPKEHLKKFMKR